MIIYIYRKVVVGVAKTKIEPIASDAEINYRIDLRAYV